MKKQSVIIIIGIFLIVFAIIIIIPSSYAFNNEDLLIEVLNVEEKNNLSTITLKITKQNNAEIDTNKFKIKIKDNDYYYNDYLYIGNITKEKIISIILPEHFDNNLKISYDMED